LNIAIYDDCPDIEVRFERKAKDNKWDYFRINKLYNWG
jgi:hypothetical protein